MTLRKETRETWEFQFSESKEFHSIGRQTTKHKTFLLSKNKAAAGCHQSSSDWALNIAARAL